MKAIINITLVFVLILLIGMLITVKEIYSELNQDKDQKQENTTAISFYQM